MNVLVLACALIAADPAPKQSVIVAVGAEGTAEFGKSFRESAERWQQAAEQGEADFLMVGLNEEKETTDLELLNRRLVKEAAIETAEPLWLVLIGHGTFDGTTARFNLRGPDISPRDLGEWLKDAMRPIVVIDCTSCSSPFLNELSGPRRVVLTATKSGSEQNVTRFADYLSQALLDSRADLDKDDQVSLLEAWLTAAAGVREFYAKDGRLETEHSLLDDNGDRLGTPPDWFQGARAVKSAKEGAVPDGLRAARLCLVRSAQERLLTADQRSRRDELEQQLARLRLKRGEFDEGEYLNQLEPLLLEIARLYQGQASPAFEGKDDKKE